MQNTEKEAPLTDEETAIITDELISILYEHAGGDFETDGTPKDAVLWRECGGLDWKENG